MWRYSSSSSAVLFISCVQTSTDLRSDQSLVFSQGDGVTSIWEAAHLHSGVFTLHFVATASASSPGLGSPNPLETVSLTCAGPLPGTLLFQSCLCSADYKQTCFATLARFSSHYWLQSSAHDLCCRLLNCFSQSQFLNITKPWGINIRFHLFFWYHFPNALIHTCTFIFHVHWQSGQDLGALLEDK